MRRRGGDGTLAAKLATGGQARHIAATDNAYTEIIKRHAARLVADGRGDFYFAKVESDTATLWVLDNSTVTYHDERQCVRCGTLFVKRLDKANAGLAICFSCVDVVARRAGVTSLQVMDVVRFLHANRWLEANHGDK